MHEARHRARSNSDASSHGTWDSDSDREDGTPEEVEVPKPLNVRASQVMGDGQQKTPRKKDELPAILRIGPMDGARPSKSIETQRYDEEAQANPWADQQKLEGRQSPGSNNPYLKQTGFAGENSQKAWQEVKPPPPPSTAPPLPPVNAPPAPPVELPTIKSPSEELSEMSLGDRNHGNRASWETAEVLTVPQQGQSPLPPVTGLRQAQNQQRPESTWWQDPAAPNEHESAFAPPEPPPKAPAAQQLEPEYAPPSGSPPGRSGSLIDHEEAPAKFQRPTPAPITTSKLSGARTSDAVPETPGTALKRQRNEHYQIKHVNWCDASSASDPRTRSGMRNSPILTQNANGPCPLLALVNALVLSTPQSLYTPLIETLRTREQVSLGLLLDAVFDELMSGRRGDTACALPDVSELYSFLLALHTGMNVNPRFVTPTTTPRGSLDGHPPDLNGIHPLHRAQSKPGAFEETKEMQLYSTFNIPLIHGWTAPADTPAYEAFVRSAQTFEDAQNIQFAEAELADKLQSEGLTPQEQQTLQDIQTIKAFLNTWPTQLTDYGLQTISKTLQPGQIAILFRNDHFSTLYKEPKHGALMTLVTDTGYSSHAEIVWESLVDVNGSASEMFSGDFRVVSHNQDVRLNQGNSAGGEDGWQTVQSRDRYSGRPQKNRNSQGAVAAAQEAPPPLPGPRPSAQQRSSVPQDDGGLDDSAQSDAERKAAEQEDHDLALALQLQEEEEDQQRQAEERRRREQELSEQFLSNESEGPRPPIPPRRTSGRAGGGPNTNARGGGHTANSRGGGPTTNARGGGNTRPATHRPTAGDPEAPPSYEQAWSDPPYRPAGSTAPASLSQGNPLGAYNALRRQQSAYAQQSSTTVNSPTGAAPPGNPHGHNRRQSNSNRVRRRSSQLGAMPGPSMPGGYVNSATNPQRVGQAPGVKEAEDKCVVM